MVIRISLSHQMVYDVICLLQWDDGVFMGMENGPIQKLLLTQEYEDIEDIVLVESIFVELDKRGDGLQLVSLAITPDQLILGRYRVINYHDEPRLVYDADRDVSIDGLEIKWVAPLEHINISHIPGENILQVTPRQSKARHFELCTSVNSQNIWNKWNSRLGYITDDPYRYISRKSLHVDASERDLEEITTRSASDSDSEQSDKVSEAKEIPTINKKKEQGQTPKEQIDTNKSKMKKKKKKKKKGGCCGLN